LTAICETTGEGTFTLRADLRMASASFVHYIEVHDSPRVPNFFLRLKIGVLMTPDKPALPIP
jgi:hypothetical protein